MTRRDATSTAKAPLGLSVPGDLPALVEAVLLAADRPVPGVKLAEALLGSDEGGDGAEERGAVGETEGEGTARDAAEPAEKAGTEAKRGAGSHPGLVDVQNAIAALNEEYERTGRSFRVELVAGGYRVMTLPRYAEAVAAYHAAKSSNALSPAALETLAIIAYRQPITRAMLESIRGVACGEVLRSLTERGLISVAGRAEEPGRPLLYATTRRFLEAFGLASLKDLPAPHELRRE